MPTSTRKIGASRCAFSKPRKRAQVYLLGALEHQAYLFGSTSTDPMDKKHLNQDARPFHVAPLSRGFNFHPLHQFDRNTTTGALHVFLPSVQRPRQFKHHISSLCASANNTHFTAKNKPRVRYRVFQRTMQPNPDTTRMAANHLVNFHIAPAETVRGVQVFLNALNETAQKQYIHQEQCKARYQSTSPGKFRAGEI